MDPYRTPAVPAANEPPPPRELVYEALLRDRSGNVYGEWARHFGGPMLVGIALGMAFDGFAALVGFLGSLAFALWYRKHGRPRQGAVFRVAGGSVRVFSPDGRRETASFKMRELASVELDLKTIERLQDGSSPIPALRFANPTVAPAVDTARIVLVRKGGRRHILTDAYLAHMDAIEGLGKIRAFLRKHGWMPEAERAELKEEKRRLNAERMRLQTANDERGSLRAQKAESKEPSDGHEAAEAEKT